MSNTIATNNIRKIMKAKRLANHHVCKRGNINPSVFSRILSEDRDFKFSIAVKIAKGLGCSLDEIAGLKTGGFDRIKLQKLIYQMDDLNNE